MRVFIQGTKVYSKQFKRVLSKIIHAIFFAILVQNSEIGIRNQSFELTTRI